MFKTDTIWVEIESGITNYRVRTFRGKASSKDVERLTAGHGIEFIQLLDCYWYNDADDESETGKPQGTFEHLGQGPYANFTGEIFLRCSTILNVAILKAGFEGETVNS